MHLSDTELRDFKTGALAPDDLLRADDHLSACDQCRARAVALLVGEPADHLSDDDLQLFVQGRLDPGAYDAARHHLANCSTCAGQAADLRAWIQPTAAPRIQQRRLALAAAILAAAVIPTVIWQMRSGRQNTPPSLSGIEALAPAEQARVQAALSAGAASLPDFMADVKSSREVLMGEPGNPGDTFNLVAPVATGTVSDRPRFEWQPLAGADGYIVTVFDERSSVVAQGAAVTETNWEPPTPLPRDRTFVWQVTAHRGSQSITAPAAPTPPARFHIIGESQAKVLGEVEAGHPQSHLLAGILNMQAGVVDAAIRHLKEVKPDDPHAGFVRRSLQRLQEN
jgi:hypothetical protein